MKKEIFNFKFLITKPTTDFTVAADKLFESGCGDATLSISNNIYTVEFSREAASSTDAVLSAITDFRRANIGSRIITFTYPGPTTSCTAITDNLKKNEE